ncbi:MAG: cysteine desulfurase family protein, partial [Rhodothermia bacterium]
MEVYLDNAATTKLDERVLKVMIPFLSHNYGNASSPHSLGRKARFAVEDARERVAAHLGAEPGEIVFTSGGTEANNLALCGGIRSSFPHLITSSAEHQSVLEPAREMAAGGTTVSMIDPGSNGSVATGDLARHLEGRRGLVSLMYVNNETGALNPIPEIAAVCRGAGALFHSDAVQAPGWMELNVDAMGVDLLTISAHKIYGPKGIGVLFARADTVDLQPLIRGGSQERRRRGGTENVAGIVGLAAALDLVVENRSERRAHYENLKAGLSARLASVIDEGVVVNSPADGAPHLLNISFLPTDRGPVDGEMLLLNLDVAGISVSSGSACTSGTVEPSHVLLAMGRDPATASASVRFSFGKDNTLEQMDFVA